MEKPKIEIEIHVPGLNLHTTRWSMHKLFLQEIEPSFNQVASAAWKGYQEVGRGSVFVHHDQWMKVIEKKWQDGEETFPHDYVPFYKTVQKMELGPLNQGLLQILAEYDPEKQVVLCVRHHPGEMFSAYLISWEPGPMQASEKSLQATGENN